VTTTYVPGARWSADDNRWESAKKIIGERRVTLGPQASQQWLDAPDHLAMVLSRYRAAAALIGGAQWVGEFGCGEGIGARILAKGRYFYCGIDNDAAAIEVAIEQHGDPNRLFFADDVMDSPLIKQSYDAIVSLDVIEHIPADREDAFMQSAIAALEPNFPGMLVLGTPNAAFDHLASPQSKAGHINTYSHDRLHALMSRYFLVVQSFGLQDTGLHLGHPQARHYLLMAGIGLR
jgi:2-polyprenyl-3-methyl-5-hydroxy-6-metoxy-1,4-benzoquinol methylase